MRRIGLINRIDRISATRSHVDVTRLARRIAEHHGIAETELMAEAARIAAVCRQQGITSTEGMVQHLASELGITAEELAAEMARYQELTG